jgi:hypothetical protein
MKKFTVVLWLSIPSWHGGIVLLSLVVNDGGGLKLCFCLVNRECVLRPYVLHNIEQSLMSGRARGS